MIHSRNTSSQSNDQNNSHSSGSCQSPDHNLAMILAGIVIVFAVCHFFRIFLAFYHVSVVEQTRLCIEKGHNPKTPDWLYVISAFNHLMLMINSSVNFIIYCAVGSKFRQEIMGKLCGENYRPQNYQGESIPLNGVGCRAVRDNAVAPALQNGSNLGRPSVHNGQLAKLIIHETPTLNDFPESDGKSPSTAFIELETINERPETEANSISPEMGENAPIQTLTHVYCQDSLTMKTVTRNLNNGIVPLQTCSSRVTEL